MKDMEFYASSVDEAIAKAAARTGIPASELDYEVLDEGSQGFLGIGVRDARIKVKNAVPLSPSCEEAEASPAPEKGGWPDYEETPPPEAPREAPPETLSSGELLQEVEELAEKVIAAMGFEARVDVYETEECIAVDVSSDNTALFIGQKGETIDALQFLINSIIYKKRPFHKRIVLDSEGYRQRRVEAIQGMAHRTARRALRERRRIEMPPMSPPERRIVHLYLRDNPKVTTASEGKGEGRRVVVYPST